MHPLVNINILNWNDKRTIIPAIQSALLQDYDNIKVLLIDNKSTDDSLEIIKRTPFKNRHLLTIIENDENKNFARGHNQAFHLSQGEFILCLNADAILTDNFVSEAVKIMMANDGIGAIQGKLIRYDFDKDQPSLHNDQKHNIIDTVGLTMLKNRRIINTGQGQPDTGQYDFQREIFGPDGAVPVYRKKALDDVKYQNDYFDSDFYFYKEDVDLAWRLRNYGWKTIYTPKAIAFHGRGAGESASKNFFQIIKERRKIKARPKFYSFKNQRLMQIKNEDLITLIKHFHHWLPKEILSWIYVLFFETFILKAAWLLAKQTPQAMVKRKFIKANRRISRQEMEKWFE